MWDKDKKKKLENYTGEIAGNIKYYAGTDTKKSCAKFDMFIDTRALGFIKVTAFDDLADQINEVAVQGKITVGVHKSADGNYILQNFKLQTGDIVVQARTQLTEEQVQELNKSLIKEGVALVPIQSDGRRIQVRKALSETIVINGKRFDKLEYIMDTLGAGYVNERLKAEGLLSSKGLNIKLTKEFIGKYRNLKNELLKQALEAGTN